MRKLAAILFADMTGYTQLVQENEGLARDKRKKLKEVMEVKVRDFHGEVLQYYGDGCLVIFPSATESVLCAIEIQQQLRKEPEVPVRIGIHTGDVSIEDDAIYGEGVNLASRIETLAVPGGIFISEKVYDEIHNKGNIRTMALGYFELKHVKEPVRIYAVVNDGIAVPGRDAMKGKIAPPRNRLAVLPFVNMSADPENEYFSDGITEELLNALTRVKGLQVTSRTSAFAFKGRNHDIRDIALQLNVDKVLEGSVRKSGNKVRITAQLINAADGYHIWSENYDRNLTDIFEVQDEISGIIANRLRENLDVSPKEGTHRAPVQNLTAYTFYLKGLHFWNRLTPPDIRKSIDYFQEAILMDPGYAQAHAMVAAAHSYLGATGQMQPEKAFRIVHEYADKAIALNGEIAEGYCAKAAAYLLHDWNWKKAKEFLDKSLSLNPIYGEAFELLAYYYICVDNKQAAVNVMEEAISHDPLSISVLQSLGNMYLMAERYTEAMEQAEKLLEISPQLRIAIELKGWALGMQGDWLAALEQFTRYQQLTHHPLKGMMGLGYAHARLGNHKEALECIRKMELRAREEPDTVLDADLAAVWFGLGDNDKAFHHLNLCVDKKLGPINYILQYPAYLPIRTDPRYEALMGRMPAIETAG
ncbi:adenylate/guanylate cyclase domain-containing protein [Flavihumibacter petaseus]|nr:adenylate/guanylate cyclase domain-containing protein [Flavihumibacter petaseus]